MDDARPPPKFIRLLRCCIGPKEVCQDDNSFVQIDPVQDLDSVQAHPIPDNLSAVRNSPAHDVDPIPDDPSFVQIGPSHDSDPDVHMVPNDPSSSSTKYASNSENSSSCRHAELEKIKDQLISRSPSDLKVVPIVGMGGIGKTTLAKTLYEDAVVSRQFHLRAWIVISQDYNLENVLLSLLRSVDPDRADKVSKQKDEDLEQALYKSLKGRRYLIVLDDIWNDKTWNDFNSIFPNDDNGSRILLTTRLVEVARYVEQNHPPHCLDCLSHEESWMLLQTQVFHGKDCPSDLKEIGKEISKKCQGLPLAIVVIAGHLSNIDKRKDPWADVAKRIDSLITGSEEQILDILSLSYNHLTPQLKACFLYMGIFPKNFEIHIESLIRMFTAARLLQSEDESEKCIEDLINRNLIIVRNKKYGRDKICGIHDLLWDLSLREAQKEGHYIFSQLNPGHFRFNSTNGNVKNLPTYLTSSHICLGHYIVTGICFSPLKVLVFPSKENRFYFPEEITNLVGLRYLELHTGYIPKSISKLCNLETFINRNPSRCEPPREIWLLTRLRYLQAGAADFEIPGSCNNILETLSAVRFHSCCTELFFSRIPNLKQLKIFDIDGKEDGIFFNRLKNLVRLHHLEKLNLAFDYNDQRTREKQIPWCDLLPHCLKQLTLRGSHLAWGGMNILAMLPNIEVLKLKEDAFIGRVYEQTVEGFSRLKVLVFYGLNLRRWIAEVVHYPVLQHLVLRHCSSLKEIPCCFEEIETLKSIELVSCHKSAEKSAKTIQQEQQNNGSDIQVFISSESGWVVDETTHSSEDEMIIADSEDDLMPEMETEEFLSSWFEGQMFENQEKNLQKLLERDQRFIEEFEDHKNLARCWSTIRQGDAHCTCFYRRRK